MNHIKDFLADHYWEYQEPKNKPKVFTSSMPLNYTGPVGTDFFIHTRGPVSINGGPVGENTIIASPGKVTIDGDIGRGVQIICKEFEQIHGINLGHPVVYVAHERNLSAAIQKARMIQEDFIDRREQDAGRNRGEVYLGLQ